MERHGIFTDEPFGRLIGEGFYVSECVHTDLKIMCLGFVLLLGFYLIRVHEYGLLVIDKAV